jgi:hypothetical protein
MVKPFFEDISLIAIGEGSRAIPIENGVEELALLLNYTLGDETNLDITVEYTPDFADVAAPHWYVFSGMSLSGPSSPAPGVIRCTATTRLLIPLYAGAQGFLRISYVAPGAGGGLPPTPGTLSAFLVYGR